MTDYEVAVLDVLCVSSFCDEEELRPWAERAFEISAWHLDNGFFPPFPYLQGPRAAARSLLRREADRLEFERGTRGVRVNDHDRALGVLNAAIRDCLTRRDFRGANELRASLALLLKARDGVRAEGRDDLADDGASGVEDAVA